MTWDAFRCSGRPSGPYTPAFPSPSNPLTLSAYIHPTKTIVHASHGPNSKSERNLIILQVNINGIKTNSKGSNCLFTTHMHI